ncbi:MAG: flagellar basal body rod protein FlgB [Tissierellia bacterium]|nr:flagellar basal body rod protein FlgB [Tissierellia bacterium]
MFSQMFNNIDFYKLSLDGLSERRNANLHNISNSNTPNYKRKTVSFENQLRDAIDKKGVYMRKTHPNHLGIGRGEFSPITKEDRSGNYRADGNNVDIDVENTDLWKTYYMYSLTTDLIKGEFDKYRTIIQEGGK